MWRVKKTNNMLKEKAHSRMNDRFLEFFESVFHGKVKESEKNLEKIMIGEKIDSEQKEGYFKALEGLLLTIKSNDDKYLYFSKISFNPSVLKKLREEFKAHAEKSLHSDYDRGYFSALLDYVKVVGKIEPWKNQTKSNG